MPYSLTWLPQILENAGLKVATVDGWENRGRGEMGAIQGVLCHHTGGSARGNMPSLRLLIHGRSDLPGPLSQLGLGRDGTFYVLAAGRCNHAGKGVWQSIRTGNSSFIGIEAENTGSPQDFPWPMVQMDAYHRGVAAILRHIGKGAEFCAAHREYALPAGRKPDPPFDMGAFRATIASILNGTATIPPSIPSAEPGASGRKTLRRRDQDEQVSQIRIILGIEPGNTFGPRTEAAVRAFQRERGLVPDGIVGPKTWAALDEHRRTNGSHQPEPIVREQPEVPGLVAPPMEIDTASGLELEQAHSVLRRVASGIPFIDWDEDTTRAVQRALAELHLLNPWDDVDGRGGPRTIRAWQHFRQGAKLPSATAIDADSAAALIAWSSDPAKSIGKLAIKLGPDFDFRRNRRERNREHSVEAIVRTARAEGLDDAQTAYVLATAEHESDRFATLEEYASGDAYESRRDLGNSVPGDGRRFKGRGFVQLTGRNNYQAYAKRTGLNIVDFPEILMNWPALSAWLIVHGMSNGAYTGKRLGDFVKGSKQDFRNARRVVNGLDRADKIAQQATDWLARIG